MQLIAELIRIDGGMQGTISGEFKEGQRLTVYLRGAGASRFQFSFVFKAQSDTECQGVRIQVCAPRFLIEHEFFVPFHLSGEIVTLQIFLFYFNVMLYCIVFPPFTI